MIKYAFMKLGAGTNDISRLIFYNSVKFYVGDFVFSFQDWENGILRGNRKAPYAFKLQFGKGDPRLDLIVKEPDCRLHFGLSKFPYVFTATHFPFRRITPHNTKKQIVALVHALLSPTIQSKSSMKSSPWRLTRSAKTITTFILI